MYHLNLKLLRSFSMVASEGSITRAAELLNLTQPTVSGHIKDLEAELGCRLFYRTTRKLALSPKGQLILPAVTSLLDSAAKLKSLGEHIQLESQHTFRLGAAMYTLDLEPRTALLEGFGAHCPNIGFSIDSRLQNSQLPDLLAGKLDAALMLGVSIPAAEMDAIHSGAEECNIIMNECLIPDHLDRVVLDSRKLGFWVPRVHPLAQQATISAADLTALEVVMWTHEHGRQITEPISQYLTSQDARLINIPEGHALAVMRYCSQHVLCGLGVDWFPPTEDLVFKAVEGIDLLFDFSLVMGVGCNQAASSFYDYTRQVFIKNNLTEPDVVAR